MTTLAPSLSASPTTGALPLCLPHARASSVEFLLGATTVALMAVAAQLQVHTPLSAVPFTFQTLVALGAGLVLGRRTAAAAMAAYLLLGIVGLPIFAGGRGGFGVFSGMTWGYLMAYPIVGFLLGHFADERTLKSPWRLALLVTLGEAIIFGFGAGWQVLLKQPVSVALTQGVLIFLPWEAVKVAVLASVLPLCVRTAKRMRAEAETADALLEE